MQLQLVSCGDILHTDDYAGRFHASMQPRLFSRGDRLSPFLRRFLPAAFNAAATV
jgi:hypothetical protein